MENNSLCFWHLLSDPFIALLACLLFPEEWVLGIGLLSSLVPALAGWLAWVVQNDATFLSKNMFVSFFLKHSPDNIYIYIYHSPKQTYSNTSNPTHPKPKEAWMCAQVRPVQVDWFLHLHSLLWAVAAYLQHLCSGLVPTLTFIALGNWCLPARLCSGLVPTLTFIALENWCWIVSYTYIHCSGLVPTLTWSALDNWCLLFFIVAWSSTFPKGVLNMQGS